MTSQSTNNVFKARFLVGSVFDCSHQPLSVSRMCVSKDGLKCLSQNILASIMWYAGLSMFLSDTIEGLHATRALLHIEINLYVGTTKSSK